jgi:hypothetical protein
MLLLNGALELLEVEISATPEKHHAQYSWASTGQNGWGSAWILRYQVYDIEKLIVSDPEVIHGLAVCHTCLPHTPLQTRCALMLLLRMCCTSSCDSWQVVGYVYGNQVWLSPFLRARKPAHTTDTQV